MGIVGGLGHIGLVQSACLAKLGYKTVAYDLNFISIKNILQGKLPFYEAGLQELVEKTLSDGLLSFTSRAEELAGCELVFICVGTPALPNGAADTSQIDRAVEAIARNRKTHCLVVVKSTVPVGTSRRLTAFLKDLGLSHNVTLVSNPEFLREGSGVEDFWQPSRIVVGACSEEDGALVAGLYSPPGVPIIITSWENAELIKYASNAFLANKISFINEIGLLCEKANADVRIVSRGMGLDPRIGPNFLEAGVGFSGPCLEKDLKSLINQFKNTGEKAKILEAALEVNENKRQAVVQKLTEQLGSLKGKHIAVLGMAFKPDTDDVRDSHSLPIVKHLLSLGAILTVHDPQVKNFLQAGLSKNEMDGLEEVEWAATPYEAISGKDALLILTAWPAYRELDLKQIKDSLVYPLIVDGRNLFNKQEMKKHGIVYLGVGI